MAALLSQMAVLFAFILAGGLLAVLKLANRETSHALSVVVMDVVIPCLLFDTFASNFTRTFLVEKSEILLWSLGAFALTYLLSRGLTRLFAHSKYEAGVLMYTFLVPNFGFAGYGMIEALYGSEMLFNMVLYGLPLTVYCYTAAYRNLCNLQKMSLRNLCNPGVVSMVLGAVVGLSGWQLPAAATAIVSAGKVCMVPMSMLLTGIVIASLPMKRVFRDWRNYAVSAIRLLGIPLLMGALLLALHAPWGVFCVAVVLYAMPTGINTIIYPELVGEDCRLGAGMALMSNLGMLVTMPVIQLIFLGGIS